MACEDGQLVEAHKVILAGSIPQTTIHTPWFQLKVLSFIQVEEIKGGFLESFTKKFAEQSWVQTIRMMMTMMAQVTQRKRHKRAK